MPNGEEHRIKAQLVFKIDTILKERGLKLDVDLTGEMPKVHSRNRSANRERRLGSVGGIQGRGFSLDELAGRFRDLLPYLRCIKRRIGDRGTSIAASQRLGCISRGGLQRYRGRTATRSSITGLHHDNPKLDTPLVDSMTSMCAMMMGWGIMILAAAWFGLRRGRSWTYWALMLSGLVPLVYYFVISADYAREGASWVDGLVSILLFSIPVFLGIIAGGIALVGGLSLEPARG